ncbi:MAG: FliI/YscN family ATPase [Deltaproteobacteria bacterium]|nr:FliI/YscN family ATPase [Deltaproteobacteria bacterium]
MKLANHIDAIRQGDPVRIFGKVTAVAGIGVHAHVPGAKVGSLCEVISGEGVVKAEVVGFEGDTSTLMPLGELRGQGYGSLVRKLETEAKVLVGPGLLGRVIDAFGHVIDGGERPRLEDSTLLYSEPPPPLQRKPVSRVLDLGVRVLNALAPIGMGQRMAIIAGSGVGKSTLLGMIARYSEADVKVVALIGERGREVREFLQRDLGDGLASSVVVVATSDKPALVRLRAAYTALAVAEYFRGQGKNVLLLMDALTRFAMAQREIGLAVGEPPTAKGYPPSVFTMVPKFLERVANDSGSGSLTGMFTVLAEEDDLNDPIVDAVRAVTDGQIVLTRELALKNHFPAVHVGHTISRTIRSLVKEDHIQAAGRMRSLLAELSRVQELMEIGAYQPGSNPDADQALVLRDAMNDFLRQSPEEHCSFEEAGEDLKRLMKNRT